MSEKREPEQIMVETHDTVCDLCGREIEAWEWSDRWKGQADARIFGSAMEPDLPGWLMLRCSHCAKRTRITDGGEG